MKIKCALGLILLLALIPAIYAETDSLYVAFSDPSRPGTVKASLMMGGIKVSTHSRKDVLILSKQSDEFPFNPESFDIFTEDIVKPEDRILAIEPAPNSGKNKPDSEKIKGLRKIQSSNFGIHVEEENNIIEINMPPTVFMGRSGNELHLFVPKETALELNCVSGEIEVENINGDINVQTTNGKIVLDNVGGAVIAHSMQSIETVISRADLNKPMSFSTFNGDIDVTLPASVKATFKLKSHGDIYTDFDTSTRTKNRRISEDKNHGPYSASIEEVLSIPVNGGGADIEFTTFTGNIYIRKGE